MNNNVKSMQQAIKGMNSLEPNAKSRLHKMYTGELKPTKNDVNLLSKTINSLNARGWTGVANKLRSVLNNARRGHEINNSIKALNLPLNKTKRLQEIYNGRVKMTVNDVSFVAAAAQELTANGFNKVGMELYILLANAPLKTDWNKLNVSKLPKTLDHGSGTQIGRAHV